MFIKHFCGGIMDKRLVLVILVLFSVSLYAQVPIFANYFNITANGSPITVPLGCSSPFIYDWDGDGVKDLLFGQFTSGKVQFWKNSGTNAAPIFTTGSYVQAGGVDISVSSG
jgi:hypothetical protein